MGTVKKINIENRTYCFYNDINLKHLESKLLKINKKSYKNIGIYNVGYITIKKKKIILKTFTVCIYLLIMRVDVSKKKG